MHPYNKERIGGVPLVRTTTLLFALYAAPALGGEVMFYCADRTYGINVVGSEALIDSNWVDVELINDGEWIRVNRNSKPEFAINYKTGWQIVGTNPSVDGKCWVENVEFLDAIPLSQTAILRRSFLGLTQDEREKVQISLTAMGHYTSVADGLWGSGTEKALMLYGDILHGQGFYEVIGDENTAKNFLREVIAIENLSEVESYVEPSSTDAIASSNTQTGTNEGGAAVVSPVVAEGDQAGFKSNCMRSVDKMAELTSSMPFIDAGSVSQIWQSIGLAPTDMQGDAQTGGLLVLADPSSLTSNSEYACEQQALAYSKGINKQLRIANGDHDLVHILYDASNEERERIPAAWSFPITNFKSMDYSPLTTNVISFEARVFPNSTDVTKCDVRFHIMSSTSPAINHESMVSADGVAVFEMPEWGISWFPVILEGDQEPIKWLAQQYPVGISELSSIMKGISEAVNQNFSAYEGGFNRDAIKEAIKQVRGGTFEITDAEPRDVDPIVSSAQCQAALELARENYARAAMP